VRVVVCPGCHCGVRVRGLVATLPGSCGPEPFITDVVLAEHLHQREGGENAGGAGGPEDTGFFLGCFAATQLARQVDFFSGVFFFFVCWYKTRKSLLRLPCWARSKTPGSISIRAA